VTDGAVQHLSLELDADPRSVGSARGSLLEFLALASAETWIDPILLAASEVLTNALVHTGSLQGLEAWASPAGVRVEVFDGSRHLPAERNYTVTSATGRGLHIVDETVDRWGAEVRSAGKAVWFEVGAPVGPSALPAEPREALESAVSELLVSLRHVPLLMHWAWQEHAQALLREYLLHALDSDPQAIERHAEASDALTLLYEQIPVPRLPEDPDELLADSVEPTVTAAELTVRVPGPSVAHFKTLDSLLTKASATAARGHFLGPPIQPEIAEMRAWICDEVARQSTGDRVPRPWTARTDVRAPLADQALLRAQYRELSASPEAILATDPASIIVAVTEPVVRFLGYDSESDLLGRRIIVVVPQRFHQAHIAGTTLNATNGRRALLDIPLTVPVLRADGSEVDVELQVSPRRLGGDAQVFIARFTLA
jgi:PAS domain S-box-containing protein